MTLARLWDEVVQLCSTVALSDDEDKLIWQLNSSGRYSSRSLYGVLNYRGVTPVFTPAVWMLFIPPRVHFF